MSDSVIPYSYETWHHCITVDCKLELTPEYINERISSLENESDFRTQQFVRLYGEAHKNDVIGWFKQAQSGLAT